MKHDMPAGLAVSFVALPLCLGIAMASGAPLYAGLLSGIIGGLVVSLISGSSLAVSGPAAGLTALVSSAIISLGSYEVFLIAVIVAGLFQVILGLLKLGVIANYFPSSVIKGMLAAIGILLMMKQVPIALGYDQADFWTNGFMGLFRHKNFMASIHNFSHHLSLLVVLIALLSIAILILAQQPIAKRYKSIPAPLIVVILGILINMVVSYAMPGYALKQSQIVNIPLNIFGNITFPDLSLLFSSRAIWESGIIIGLLATLETLLCIEAVDKLDKHNRITPINRELVAQGIGNITCGLLGAIPMTAVVVRGAANVDAGAKSKLASFTHGLFLLLAVLLIPSILNKIPYASLAAILLVTGYNLAKPKLFHNMLGLGWTQFIPFFITIVVILFTDLLIGVSIGLLISIYFIIQNNFRAEYKITKKLVHNIETYNIKLNGNVTFLNKVKLRKTLDEVPSYSELTIDGSECDFIDYDILEIISEYHHKAHDRHIALHLNGIEKVSTAAVH